MFKPSLLKKLTVSAILACASLAAHATPILVGTSYTYSLSSTSSLPSGTSLATVQLTQVSSDRVDVKLSLAKNYYFAGTGPSDSPTFGFSLTSAFQQAVVSYTGTAFSVLDGGPFNLTPDGLFTHGFKLNTGGISGTVNAPLEFSLSMAGLSLDAFTLSGGKNGGQTGGYGFAAHIGNQNGKTGSVGLQGLVPVSTFIPQPSKEDPNQGGSTGGGSNENVGTPGGSEANEPGKVPEPVSLALMGLGLAALGSQRMRRKA